MRMNYSDIKEQLIENWEQFKSNEPEDLLTELANSALPIYYSDIIADWTEMPGEFTDSWQEYVSGEPFNRTIFDLMSLDLMNYYQHEFSKIYNEIADTMPAKETAE